MMKLYSENASVKEQPKQKTVQYLLNYSKQLRIVKTNKKQYIELQLN